VPPERATPASRQRSSGCRALGTCPAESSARVGDEQERREPTITALLLLPSAALVHRSSASRGCLGKTRVFTPSRRPCNGRQARLRTNGRTHASTAECSTGRTPASRRWLPPRGRNPACAVAHEQPWAALEPTRLLSVRLRVRSSSVSALSRWKNSTSVAPVVRRLARDFLKVALFESQLEAIADFYLGAGPSRDLATSRLETVARGAERSARAGGLDG
jgi:hypothetical protein